MAMRRLIVCLDVRDGRTTKGIQFVNNVDIGDPVAMAEKYYDEGADELVFYDITASSERRGIMIDVVRQVAKRIFIPFSVGGGIGSLADMYQVLHAGAEKVSVNSAAVQKPDIIREGARQFGSQCIVLGMDARADETAPSGYRVVIHGGRTKTAHDAVEWARRAAELGAGEIVVNSIDADGTKEGYEYRLTHLIAEAVSIPVVASGRCGDSGTYRGDIAGCRCGTHCLHGALWHLPYCRYQTAYGGIQCSSPSRLGVGSLGVQ